MAEAIPETCATARFVPQDGGEVLNVLGERVRVLVDGSGSGGRLLMLEITTPYGQGPPLHRHTHDDEFFYVLSGRFKFVCDGKEFVAGPGASACVPKGSRHTFVSCAEDGGPSRMLVVCTPPGLDGPFRACDAAARAGSPLGMGEIVGIFKAFDLEFVGPPLAL
ncbi:MAG: cupin domain-containing protein [Phycisphaerales bacterium]|nr:cupin domain-containing protein [Phycisphaerales bacterium]